MFPSHARLDVAASFYGRFVHVVSHLQSAILLALRLTWGWQLAEAGYGHLTHVAATVEAFRGWGIPFPMLNVYISGTTELVGGSLLMLGLCARLISVPLVFNFIVAYATASKATLVLLFAGPDHRKGYEDFINDSAFTVLVLALIMLAFGPGKVSIDYLLKRTLFPRYSSGNNR